MVGEGEGDGVVIRKTLPMILPKNLPTPHKMTDTRRVNIYDKKQRCIVFANILLMQVHVWALEITF